MRQKAGRVASLESTLLSKEYCTTIHRYPNFRMRYSVMCKVYTGYHGTSEIEHGLCARTVDNPLAKARGLSLRTGAQTMLYLSLILQRDRWLLSLQSDVPCRCSYIPWKKNPTATSTSLSPFKYVHDETCIQNQITLLFGEIINNIFKTYLEKKTSMSKYLCNYIRDQNGQKALMNHKMIINHILMTTTENVNDMYQKRVKTDLII